MDVDGWTKRVFEIQIPIEEVFFYDFRRSK